MNTTAKTALVLALVIGAVLFVMYRGGTMIGGAGHGGMMGGGSMGNGTMGGYGWMWIPTLLIICLGVLLFWVIAGRKK